MYLRSSITPRVRVIALALIAVCLLVSALPRTVTPAAVAAGKRHGPQLDFAVGRHGHVHIMLKRQGVAAAAAANRAAGLNPAFSHTLLPYNGGPVMHSNTIYAIYWLPSGYSFGATSDANFESLINRFFGDLSGTAFYNILTQYPDTTSSLNDNVTFGGSYVDTTAYPCGTTCGDVSTAGHNLSDTDIQNAVLRAAAANNWQPGQGNMYLVFYGSGVASCASFGCSNAFCAYHGQFSSNGQWIYSNMYDGGTDPGCQLGQGSPNGDNTADTEISIASHEMSESITDLDPLGNQAWQNAPPGPSGSGGEIGDLCAYIWKGITTLNNGHQYAIQSEWSNFDADCVTGDTINTSVTYTGPTSAHTGDTVTLSATFDDSNGNGVGEQTINFTLGSQTCAGTTDFATPGTSQGHASCQIVLNQPSGSATVSASYPGGLGAYQPSSTSAAFSILARPTTLTYTGASSSDYHDAATVSAQLRDQATTTGVPNRAVTFTLNNSETCQGTTDANGNASCSLTPGEMAGAYALAVRFGGDATYLPSSASASFTVNLEEASLTSTTALQLFATGQPATLSATLLEDGTTPVVGRTINIILGSSGLSCTGMTNSSGVASCQVTPPATMQGPQTVTDNFTSDGYYQTAANTQQALTFSYIRGAFTLGDKTAASAGSSTVTWWADTWSSLNTLSGGPAPSAFKGFGATIFMNGVPTTNNQVTCGATYATNTTGGNSSNPPATVPAYMAVAVSNKVTRAGNFITGNVPQVVIVRTNPGYGPQPSSHGTGTIVATLCH